MRPGAAATADSWFHALPWVGGVPRDAIIRLNVGASPTPAEQELYGGGAASEDGASGSVAEPGVTHCDKVEPVNCVTGNFYEQLTDLAVAGRGRALVASRSYNAQLAGAQYRAGVTDLTDGVRLGPGWTHAYGASLELIGDAVVLHAADAATSTFTATPDGSYSAAERVKATLMHNGDGTFTVTYRDQTRDVFDSAGRLVRELDRNGYATTLSYDGARLVSVTNDAGRSLTYAYDANGRIATITDPLGRQVSLEHPGFRGDGVCRFPLLI
jgi:YD repeat-containing protein